MFIPALLLACTTPEPVETPFEGPGLDTESGQLVAQEEPFVVGLTELHVKNAPAPGEKFGDHAQAIGEYLFKEQPPGFVGGSFRNVGQLEWWTMTVWTDEDAMMEFVLSEPHVNAMADLSVVSKAARSTHVSVPAGGEAPTWDWALDTLEAEPWLIGGDR